jgi:hypothetical protein
MAFCIFDERKTHQDARILQTADVSILGMGWTATARAPTIPTTQDHRRAGSPSSTENARISAFRIDTFVR